MYRPGSPRSRSATRLELSDAAVGALRLAGVLAQCPALVELNLAYNKIGAEEARRPTLQVRHNIKFSDNACHLETKLPRDHNFFLASEHPDYLYRHVGRWEPDFRVDYDTKKTLKSCYTVNQ